ncbi:unnamed protein product [Paramecium sonneborni]|uniref:Uncharacterized protein n=1 Tax=Paramecium sonneborni TaxID=65129 RepID=A0A8S1PAA6_9CILI|nr:unnamed protein product [Paramecium sonneborni]
MMGKQWGPNNDGCFYGQYDCPEYCEHCHQGLCLKCSKISSQLDNLTNQCLTFCGDGYLTNQEYFDDENNILYEGCYECKFQRNQFCQICENGICFECQLGYSLNKLQNICDSVCGNGIITHNEEFDNGNLQLLNECSNCKLQCQEQCIICVNGQCLECIQDGWQLNLIDMNCQPICGHQLVLSNEQCDDGNDKENDGCANCFFKCQDECTLCEFGKCRECGYEGWELIVNECFPICGDYLVLGNEEGDDGNRIRSDGCFECKYLCQDQCNDCVGGYCKACNTRGWEFNKIIFVLLYVEMVSLLIQMNNVMMVMIYHMMVVIYVNFNMNNYVHYVNKEYVLNVINQDIYQRQQLYSLFW